MSGMIDENGKIKYKVVLHNLKTFLYGRKAEIDTTIHLNDLRFYQRNFRLVLRSLSLSLVYKMVNLWQRLGYRIVQRYFQLAVVAVINKLKEREKARRDRN